MNGRPLEIGWAAEHVPAILEAWYPGNEGGNGIADLLFGDANPAGHLPVSWPRSSAQLPLYYNHNLTQMPEDAADFTSRYWDTKTSPLYPFGYGLELHHFRLRQPETKQTRSQGGLGHRSLGRRAQYRQPRGRCRSTALYSPARGECVTSRAAVEGISTSEPGGGCEADCPFHARER